MCKDLDAKPDTSIYAHWLKEQIESRLSLWISTLDPMKYRKLYVKKVNQDGPPIPG